MMGSTTGPGEPARPPGDVAHLARLLQAWSDEASSEPGPPVRLEGPELISFLPIRYQLGQKLHACTENVGEPTDQRVRDLHDILLIEELAVGPGDYSAIREACVEIFDSRNKHPWPPEITVWPDWEQMWTDLVTEEGLVMTLQEAVAAVEAFVAAVDAAASPSVESP